MVAVITGAGRGLGRAVALELAQHGWDLALIARTASQLDAVADETRAFGIRAETFPASADVEAEVREAFSSVRTTFGRMDALVHCAGIGSFAPVLEADSEEWARILNVNVFGTFLCCREAARVMVDQRSGHIVNVLSIAAKTVFPGSSAYCASKWGALALTKVLSEEVRREGVRVTALCPGSIHTPFWDQISHPFDVHDMLRPEDVAATIRFLLEQPPTIHTDELVVTPPKGIL